jgi:hypothetical protein
LRLGWDNIQRDAANFQLVAEKDLIQWKFGNNGHFSVKSVYEALTVGKGRSLPKSKYSYG